MNRRDFIKKTSVAIPSISLISSIGNTPNVLAEKITHNSDAEFEKIFKKLDQDFRDGCAKKGLRDFADLKGIYVDYVISPDMTGVYAWWEYKNGRCAVNSCIRLWTSDEEKQKITRTFINKYETNQKIESEYFAEFCIPAKNFHKSYTYGNLSGPNYLIPGFYKDIHLVTVEKRKIVSDRIISNTKNRLQFCENFNPHKFAENQYITLSWS